MIDEENGQTRKTKGGKRYQKKQKGKKGKIAGIIVAIILILLVELNGMLFILCVTKDYIKNIVSNIIRCRNWNGCWKNIKNKF